MEQASNWAFDSKMTSLVIRVRQGNSHLKDNLAHYRDRIVAKWQHKFHWPFVVSSIIIRVMHH